MEILHIVRKSDPDATLFCPRFLETKRNYDCEFEEEMKTCERDEIRMVR